MDSRQNRPACSRRARSGRQAPCRLPQPRTSKAHRRVRRPAQPWTARRIPQLSNTPSPLHRTPADPCAASPPYEQPPCFSPPILFLPGCHSLPFQKIRRKKEQGKMESNASLRIKTIRRDQKRPERMKRPEQKFRAFHSFGPYCRGLGGDSPPSRRRHCLSLYYFDSVKSASITSSSAFLPPAAPAPGWAPAAPAASAPGCWP